MLWWTWVEEPFSLASWTRTLTLSLRATAWMKWRGELGGETYEEIAKAGGGIVRSVEALRTTPFQKIVEQSQKRLHQMRARGTTTVEIKTGYGLEPQLENLQLDVIDKLRSKLLNIPYSQLRWRTSYLPTGVTTDKNTSTNSAPRSWNQLPFKSVCSFVMSL